MKASEDRHEMYASEEGVLQPDAEKILHEQRSIRAFSCKQ